MTPVGVWAPLGQFSFLLLGGLLGMLAAAVPLSMYSRW